jgi:hypothetical protein
MNQLVKQKTFLSRVRKACSLVTYEYHIVTTVGHHFLFSSGCIWLRRQPLALLRIVKLTAGQMTMTLPTFPMILPTFLMTLPTFPFSWNRGSLDTSCACISQYSSGLVWQRDHDPPLLARPNGRLMPWTFSTVEFFISGLNENAFAITV